MVGSEAPRGHERLPHTADVRLRAWAPAKLECLAEAVTALVASFASVAPGAPTERFEVAVTASRDEDLLVTALEEVIFLLESDGRVPAGVSVAATPQGVRLCLEVTDVTEVEQVGAVPKAISWHDLQFTSGPGTANWSCQFTVDV
jgi:SHS2 domain-containing protein